MIKTRSTHEKVLIILSGMGFLFIFPFSLLRFAQEKLLLGSVDLLISGIMLVFCLDVLKTRRVERASIVVAVIGSAGVILSVYLQSVQQIFWLFPAILTAYYLMPPKHAVVLTVPTQLICLIIIYKQAPLIEFSTIAATTTICNVFAYAFSSHMHDQQARLLEQANRDPLTQSLNRRALTLRMEEIEQVQQRAFSDVCMMIFDLDLFKAINDDYGHSAGDEVLRQTAALIKERIRTTDKLYRFGGEEFVIIQQATDIDHSKTLAEELRKKVAEFEFTHGIRLTLSAGVAAYSKGQTYAQWLEQADLALYRAKRGGRNQVCLAS